MSTPATTPKAAFHCWNDVAHEQVTPQLGRRLVTGDRMMVAQVDLARGCLVAKHAHVHEQITLVVAGCLRLRIGDDGAESYDLCPGDVLCIPSNVPHAAEALEETRVLDVFSPPREDWLNRTDDYLRR